VSRIAITGHMNLTADSEVLIRRAITGALALYVSDKLTGISCIARGADSIFAQAVLDFAVSLKWCCLRQTTRKRRSSLTTQHSLTN
jgi:hypothetical protein